MHQNLAVQYFNNMRNFIFSFYQFFQTHKNKVYILIIIFALTRFSYLNYLNWNYGTLCTGYSGIQYGCDAPRYIEGAENLIQGKGIIGFRKAYVGYMAIIALGRVLGLGLEFVLVIQLIVTLLAALALYDLIKFITNSKTAGIIGATFYLVCPFIVTWVLFIHTESLYSSMLVLSAWAIYKAIQKRTMRYYFLLLLVVGFTTTLRPNGWILIPISIFFLIRNSAIDRRLKYLTYASVIIVFILVMNHSPWFSKNRELDRFNQLILSGQIICDPDTYHLAMPKEVFPNKNDLPESMMYIAKHPVAFVKLGFLKIASELLPIYRPWLSVKFILRFLIWMLPAYLFTIISSLFLKKRVALQIVLALLLSHLIIIAFTFSEREFRFLTHIIPLFYLAGSCGFYFVVKKVLIKTGLSRI
jgi:hypothetical protein